MFRSLQVAATGMIANETQLDTIANNLANSNTNGYKRQDAQFEDLLYDNVRAAAPTPGGGVGPTITQLGSGARVVATARSFSQGAIQQTGNQLDVAIEGSGFLVVSKNSGELAYTRDGSLKVDAQGRLVTNGGLPIQPAITVPQDATSITIGADGTVTATTPGNRSATQLGQLQLATFPNPNGLSAAGHNLFEPSSASGEPMVGNPGEAGRGAIMQNALEASNVEVVNEMVAMIRTQRAYEINSKVVSAADEMLRNAVQTR